MATLNQEKVVKTTSENIGKKKKIIKGKILKEVGYSESIQKSPKIIYESKGVKEKLKPFVDKLVEHRDKVIKEMDAKDLSKEQYKVLGEELGRINHDIQLLSGGATERTLIIQFDDSLAPKTKKNSQQ